VTTHKFKTGDLVRIRTEHLSDVLIQELGSGRACIYIGKVLGWNGDRVIVFLQDTHRSLWFDADVLTTNFTVSWIGDQV
jgi:hypothetical protein